MSERTRWLREVADPIDQKLLNAVFAYEKAGDDEWGTRRSVEQLEVDDDDSFDAVRLIATRYADRPGYRKEWGCCHEWGG